MSTSMREALESAFEQHADEPASDPQASPEPAEQEPTSQPDDVAAPIEAEGSPEVSVGERVRDSLGRFTKPDQVDGKGQVPPAAEKPPTVAPDPSQQPLQPLQPGQVPAGGRPPAPRHWPIAAREKWNNTDPVVREQIMRRDQEFAEMQEQARPSIEFAQRYMQMLQPYQQVIQTATGGDHMLAVSELLKAETILRNGMPSEKAGFVAHLINKYGVDIEGLDKALVGIQPDPQQQVNPQYIQQAIHQALSPLMQRAQAREREARARTDQQVSNELQTFAADPKNEFFEDVRKIMANVWEIGEREGNPVTLADAYRQACLLHPEVSKIILARQQGQSAQSLTAAAQRARAAAVSVKGSAPVGSPDPSASTSVRDAIEAAIEAHSRV